MFILHSSNKTENLVAHLTAVMTSAPLASPFAEEVFLIQSQGMERWLCQQLASTLNVWGHYRFLFPAKFFGLIAEQLGMTLNDELFSRDVLLWRIEARLRSLQGDHFEVLKYYLNSGNPALKRFQLARQLAYLFDQYQIMRPDMLDSWEHGQLIYANESEQWQKALWGSLLEGNDGRHRGHLWQQLIDRLQASDIGVFQDTLPERVSIFGINTLPPLFLALLQSLAKHVDVHLYLLNPVQVYWADIPAKKVLAKLENFDGHPLLVALGQQGREFQQMLLEQSQFEMELDSFEEHSAVNTLQRLQNDLLANQVSRSEWPPDASITVHACHSRMREVQVVKAQLLRALETQPDLELRDIVVMAPDIQPYAPFIHTVFSDIPHAIADRSLRMSNALLDIFLNFLEITQSRFGWRGVLELLDHSIVYRNFDLDEEALELIRFWVDDLRVRWGRDAEHREQLELPPYAENTWKSALDRLFMGYAMAEDDEFCHQILPYPHIEGLSAQALGGLQDFLNVLFQAADQFQKERTLQQWGELLYDFAERLLSETDSVERHQLNELLLNLSTRYTSLHQEPVAFVAVVQWLNELMAEQRSSQGFLRGQLTFCSMLPMRSIPFEVIALLGMNDGEFPQTDRPPIFDLLGQQFRLGDRSHRADDRYQFLEILLSARRQLIMTYIGQSIQDNQDIPPSVIVTELLDVLDEHYQLSELSVRHPLQAFSQRYFDASSSRLFSYQSLDLELAIGFSREPRQARRWWSGDLPVQRPQVIEIDDLLAFYRHPQRFFMRRQLGLYLEGIGLFAEEREPFSVNGLDAYVIQQQWVAERLQQHSLSLSRLQAKGIWPVGAQGELIFAEAQPQIDLFVDKLLQKSAGEPVAGEDLDLAIGPYRLVGKLDHLYANGCLLYRFTRLKGKDFMTAWLQHHLMNRYQPSPTWLISTDYDLEFPAAVADEAQLIRLLDIFAQGQTRPDVFFTEAVFDYAMQAGKVRTQIPPLEMARNMAWKRIELGQEPELRQIFPDRSLLEQRLDSDFAEFCLQTVVPVWQVLNER